MNSRTSALLFGASLIVASFASSAAGQAQRTFVSGLGSDGNACSRLAPCRTFTQALSLTNAGGEVYVLDTAGYGPFAITKAVAIVAPQGVTAGISVFSGDGIDITAGPSAAVILRGLTLNNQGSSGNGIVFNSGATLHVENCSITGFNVGANSAGILFSGFGVLDVKDSTLRRNSVGIEVNGPSEQSALAAIEQVRLEENTIGLTAMQGSSVTVRNTLASGGSTGIRCQSTNAFFAELNVENCLVFNNLVGVQTSSNASGGATLRLSNSAITSNGVGLKNFGGLATLLSRSNNTVERNGTDVIGTIGSYTPQ